MYKKKSSRLHLRHSGRVVKEQRNGNCRVHVKGGSYKRAQRPGTKLNGRRRVCLSFWIRHIFSPGRVSRLPSLCLNTPSATKASLCMLGGSPGLGHLQWEDRMTLPNLCGRRQPRVCVQGEPGALHRPWTV